MKRKNLACFLCLICAMLMVFSAASAQSWNGEAAVKTKAAFGEQADVVKDVLGKAELQLCAGEDAAALVVNGTALSLKGGACAALKIALNLQECIETASAEMLEKLDIALEGVEKRSDVFSSLFTKSRYRELSREEMLDLLSCALPAALMNAAGETAETLEEETEAQYSGEVTFFETHEKFLLKLDFTAGERDFLLTVQNDDAGLSLSLFADQAVKDWDEAKDAILSGESAEGFGISAFALTFPDPDESEDYLEITVYGEAEKTCELSKLYAPGKDRECALEALFRVNGDKVLTFTADLKAGEDEVPAAMTLEDAKEALGDDVFSALKICFEVIGSEE